MNTFSLERILLDGGLICLAISVIIFGSLWYNPRLWLHDYPAHIRAAVPPNTPQEKRLQRLLMIPFLLVLLGGPLLSALALRTTNGGALPFLSAYLHIVAILNLMNLFDAVVIDLLALALLKPRFAILPGTENMAYQFGDWGLHLKNYLKGIVFAAVFSLPLALVVSLLPTA